MLNLLLTLALATSPQAKPATNSLCPVTGEKVDAKSPVTVVRGQAYRFCCAGCDKKVLADPGKYLDKDGTPKNAEKAPSGHKAPKA